MRRPLDRFGSIKVKLGIVIVAAVGVTVLVVIVGAWVGLPLVICGVIAGLLSLGMIQLLARGMTSPLRDMASATRAMARGEYDRRVVDSSRDEVGELARAFNRMAAELAEVDRMRKDLIANVSHELRTPLTALQATLENIVDGVAPADQATLQTMLGQTQRLGRLVEQLLDLSRLESGTVPLELQPFAVKPMLEQTVRESSLGPEHGGRIEVRLAVEPADLVIVGDPERVNQVVANVVQNALRHSPPDGTVDVTARANADGVLIEVSDEGPGIPIEEAGRVFERFYRSDHARTSRDGGTGLGLAIAKWIVDMHGGEIRAEAREPRGCRMVVSLPRSQS
ncbi:HAMP domain-containing sensor histidine kinase [soil metagenome]